MARTLMVSKVTKYDCLACGQQCSVWCATPDSGLVCQACGTREGGNPYAGFDEEELPA